MPVSDVECGLSCDHDRQAVHTDQHQVESDQAQQQKRPAADRPVVPDVMGRHRPWKAAQQAINEAHHSGDSRSRGEAVAIELAAG